MHIDLFLFPPAISSCGSRWGEDGKFDKKQRKLFRHCWLLLFCGFVCSSFYSDFFCVFICSSFLLHNHIARKKCVSTFHIRCILFFSSPTMLSLLSEVKYFTISHISYIIPQIFIFHLLNFSLSRGEGTSKSWLIENKTLFWILIWGENVTRSTSLVRIYCECGNIFFRNLCSVLSSQLMWMKNICCNVRKSSHIHISMVGSFTRFSSTTFGMEWMKWAEFELFPAYDGDIFRLINFLSFFASAPSIFPQKGLHSPPIQNKISSSTPQPCSL